MSHQLLLTSMTSDVLRERGSEKALNECLGTRNGFPSASQIQLWYIIIIIIIIIIIMR